jgi:hypothetical protein
MATLPNNDPSRPTCRVVKRVGQRGARIHPPGCQVRAEVAQVAQGGRPEFATRRDRYNPQGDYVEYTKRGTRKRVLKRSHHLDVYLAPVQVEHPAPPFEFMWDSGATYVSMGGDAADYLFSVYWRNIHNRGVRGVDWDYGRTRIADNSFRPQLILFNKAVIVNINGHNERITIKRVSISIKGDARGPNNIIPLIADNGYLVPATASNLFGLSGIKALKDIKLKFRD